MATASRISGVSDKSDPENRMVSLYVWEWPVRITHWVIFLSIVVLTFTGYYLYDPFIISRGNRAFLMAKMRFIHEIAGFVFIAGLLVRGYWFFVGNKWARWREFVPIGRKRRHDLKEQLGYYLFWRRKPPFTIGHNPLAGASYTVVYFLMFVEGLTGLALYNHVLGSKTLGFFINWLPWLISVRYLRAIHFFIMFALWAFFIHHVYSAILIGIEERSGLVGSIFSGYKFFPESRLTEDSRRE